MRRYVHGDGADTPLVWYEGTGTGSPQYLYTDHQGSIVARTDASGTVLNLNAYDEYGIPNTTNTGRFQYTGQAWLPELGLYRRWSALREGCDESAGQHQQSDMQGRALSRPR